MAVTPDRHPEAEQLARYTDDSLPANERAEIERHLVVCAQCRDTVADTIAFLESEREGEGGLAGQSQVASKPSEPLPFRPRRPRWIAIAGIAASVAASLLVLIRVIGVGGTGDRPELRELATALKGESRRPVEGRLVGPFEYAAAPSPTRGPNDRAVSPEVRIAAAKLEQLAKDNDSPANREALGLAYLALGDFDAAIDAIGNAVQRESGNAVFQSDLSAALLARAKWWARAEDWAAALNAADRAISLDPKRPEAYFNRALALEGLHLADQAVQAWVAYQRLDTSGKWYEESVQHLRELRGKQDPSAQREQRPIDHQAMRESLEDEMFTTWANSVNAHQDAAAAQALDAASRAADALVDAGGDAMARDEVRRITRVAATGDATTLRELAAGHLLFGEARRAYARDDQQQASERMTQAELHFAKAGSDYAQWAPVYRSIYLRNHGDTQAALDEVSTPVIASVPNAYHHLRGRAAWCAAVAFAAMGRYDRTLERIKPAIEAYRAAGEVDNLVATWTIQVEAEWFLGDTAHAWSDLLGILAYIDSRGGSRRDYHLWLGATMARNAGLADAAVDFHDARVQIAKSPRSKTEAYLHRARARAFVGDRAGAEDDLRHAEETLAALTDPTLRQRNLTDIRIARAEVLSESDPARALQEATAALQYVPQADPATRLAELLTLRAKCRESLGDASGARLDLVAAIDAFEHKRSQLKSIHDRTQAFERERLAFGRLIGLDVAAGKMESAFATAERMRAGAFPVSWASQTATTADLAQVPQVMPEDTAVIYYQSLPDRVLVWILTRAHTTFVSKPVGADALDRMIAPLLRAIHDGADLRALTPYSNELVASLVEPALRAAGDAPTLFIVPDGALWSLPFAALPDRNGHPLVASRTVGIAPSLSAFLAATRRLEHFTPTDVLAIGDGHDPASTGLPRLPLADAEAGDIAQAYAHGTVWAGAAAIRPSTGDDGPAVLHFSGHTVADLRFPMLSRLLLASVPGSADGGAWLASDIAVAQFHRTGVVVLSSCNSAAGKPIAGEGAISMARAFFSAGVPAIVASLWPVRDDVRTFMVGLHQELQRHPDAASALRTSQLAMLSAYGPRAPVRDWGGFVAYGGTHVMH